MKLVHYSLITSGADKPAGTILAVRNPGRILAGQNLVHHPWILIERFQNLAGATRAWFLAVIVVATELMLATLNLMRVTGPVRLDQALRREAAVM